MVEGAEAAEGGERVRAPPSSCPKLAMVTVNITRVISNGFNSISSYEKRKQV